MIRITNNLFESIQKVTAGEVAEASVDKAHFCATHVEHSLLGYGECISEQHAAPDENGDIAWYTVHFPTGTHKVNTSQLRVVEGKSHMHSKKMAEDTEAIEEAEGGVPKTDAHKKLAAHYGDPNKITRGDVITAAKKNAMKKEEVEQIDELKTSTLKSYADKSEKSYMSAKDSKTKTNRDMGLTRADKKLETKANSGNPFRKEETDVGYAQKSGTKAGHALYSKKLSNEPQTSKSDVTLQSGATANSGKSYNFPKGTKFVSLPGGIFGQHPNVPETHPKVGHLIKSSDDNIKKIHNSLKRVIEANGKEKDTSAFDWKSKAKNSESSFEKKKTNTGTVYTRKPSKEKEDMKEGVSQTVINHQDFVLEITDNPTFADYFNAMQAIVPSMDENIQKEMITIATEAYNEGYIDVILESMAREAFSTTLNNYRKEGYSVLDEHYIVESNEPYVEYTLEKDGAMTKYVHVGAVVNNK